MDAGHPGTRRRGPHPAHDPAPARLAAGRNGLRPPMPGLDFTHVSHRFGETLAVDDVSIGVEAGELACLLGPVRMPASPPCCDSRPPRNPSERPHRHRRHRRGRGRCGPPTPPREARRRVDVPGLRPVPPPYRRAEHRVRAPGQIGRGTRRARGSSAPSARWVSHTSANAIRTHSRAGSSSASLC